MTATGGTGAIERVVATFGFSQAFCDRFSALREPGELLLFLGGCDSGKESVESIGAGAMQRDQIAIQGQTAVAWLGDVSRRDGRSGAGTTLSLGSTQHRFLLVERDAGGIQFTISGLELGQDLIATQGREQRW